MPQKVSLKTAQRYNWGNQGVGWVLKSDSEVSVVEERIAPAIKEVKHYHERTWQFFYILSGKGTIEIDGEFIELNQSDGIEVAPPQVHQLSNTGDDYLTFIVFSRPNPFDDRVVAE